MVRIGTVRYLNAAPLHRKLDRARFQVIEDHPSVIARMLREGAVDLALVPVGAILADGVDLRIAPGFCIGADGPVASVLLVSETPIHEWTRVLLDGVSRTSALLARVLLDGPLGKECRPDLEIADVAPTTALGRATGSTAALVIGDAALNVPDRFVHRVDLADAWVRWTGVPFVFAAWAGRPDLSPDVIAEVRRAGAEGVAAIDAEYTGREHTYLTMNIRFPLDDRALMGLRRFGALLVKGGWARSADLQLYAPEPWTGRDAGIEALIERAMDGEALGYADAVRVARGGRLADLAVAADLRRRALHLGDHGVAWWAGERDVARLVIGAGEGVEDRVRTLIAWRDAPPDAMSVIAADVQGPVGSSDNTAEDQLRWQALARLLGPPVPLRAAPATEGVGMAQLGLRMGVDEWGGAEDPVVAKHQIAEAGFTELRS